MSWQVLILLTTAVLAVVAVVAAVVAVRAVRELAGSPMERPMLIEPVEIPEVSSTGSGLARSTSGGGVSSGGEVSTASTGSGLADSTGGGGGPGTAQVVRVVEGRVIVQPSRDQIVAATMTRPSVRLGIVASGLAHALRPESRDRIAALVRREYRARRRARQRAARAAARAANTPPPGGRGWVGS